MTTVSTSAEMAHVTGSRSRQVIAFAALAIAAGTLLVAIVAVSLLANTVAPASTFGGASPNQSYQHVLRENSASTINTAPIIDASYQHVLRENSASTINTAPIIDASYQHVLRENQSGS